ncbi:4544_t:CDS:2, partial [Cetraspora pellucida]
ILYPSEVHCILDPLKLQYALEEYPFHFFGSLGKVEVKNKSTLLFLGRYVILTAIQLQFYKKSMEEIIQIEFGILNARDAVFKGPARSHLESGYKKKPVVSDVISNVPQPTDAPQPQPTEAPAQPTVAPQQPSAAPKGAASSPAQQKSANKVVTISNNAPNVITITSTSLLDSPTSKSNVNSANSNDSSSSTSIITAAIVVGTVVVAAAIGIWIFRKWKLTPSRNFKEKIQPVVDFGPRSAESDEMFLRGLHEP